MYLRNWDFEVLGSPTMQMLMSPRRLIPSGVCLCTPPISWSRSPFLTISCPIDMEHLGQQVQWLITSTRYLGLTVDSGCDRCHQPCVDVVLVDHSPELIQLLRGKRVEEGLLVVLSLLSISSDVGRSSLQRSMNAASVPQPTILRPNRAEHDPTHPCVRVLCHASEEGRLVPEISHSGLLEPTDTLARDSRLTPSSPARLLLHLCAHSGHRHLRHIRHDDESAGEGALVSCLGSFDRLGSEDDVQTVSRGKKYGRDQSVA